MKIADRGVAIEPGGLAKSRELERSFGFRIGGLLRSRPITIDIAPGTGRSPTGGARHENETEAWRFDLNDGDIALCHVLAADLHSLPAKLGNELIWRRDTVEQRAPRRRLGQRDATALAPHEHPFIRPEAGRRPSEYQENHTRDDQRRH